MSILRISDRLPVWAEDIFALGGQIKEAAVDTPPELSYNLAGTLQVSSNGWLMLSVPNALVHGIFAAMHEPGIEYPPSKSDGRLNAHISVMKPKEIESFGGVDKINERGKQYHYTLGRLYSVEPEGWPEMSKVWFVRVHSPELMALRRSYGLSSLPAEGKHDFHVSVAVLRRGVLGRNETAKS